GVPFSAFSSGIVTRLSTSSVERPGASVWISTRGGANSGKTSCEACWAARMTSTMKTTEAVRTSSLSLREVETSQFSMGASLRVAELGAEQFGSPLDDDGSACFDRAREHGG